jgi:hypothetical protein
MKTSLEIMFEGSREAYSKKLVDGFNVLIKEEFGEDFDIKHSLRLEKDGKIFAYISIERNYLTPEILKRLIKIAKKVALVIKPERVIGDYEHSIDKNYDNKEGMFWLTVFNASVIKEIGEEKLLSAPVHIAEKLEDGSIMLILNEDPWDYDKELREKVRRHLFEER